MTIDFRIFPWVPARGMVEALEWKTDVIAGVSGSEQRISVRRYPRQSFEIKCFSEGFNRSNALMAIVSGQDQVWGFPNWHERQKISSLIAAGEASIAIDTTASDYRPSDYAILWASETLFEAIEVETVGASSINLSSPVIDSWPSGTRIMPMRRVHISPSAKIEDRPTGLSDLSLNASVIDDGAIPSTASTIQHLGYDVLNDIQLMPGNTRSREINRNLWTLDPVTGAYSIKAPGEYPATTTAIRMASCSIGEAFALRSWLHRREGMAVPVWVSSRTNDLALVSTPGLLSTTITIKDIRLRDYWSKIPGRKNLAFVGTNKAIVCKQITGVEAGSYGEEVITLNEPLGINSIKKVSFLSLQRLAADRVEIAWERPGWAEVKLSMVEVPA